MDRLGLNPSVEQRNAYIALCRHFGFYLGIRPDILRTHFADHSSADPFLASMFLNMFSDSDILDPTEQSVPNPTMGILSAALSKFPSFPPLAWHLAAVHHFLGPSLAARRGIPTPSATAKIAVHVIGFLLTIPVRFGHSYSHVQSGWMQKRRALIRISLLSLIRYGLGMARTTYFPRTGVAVAKREIAKPESDDQDETESLVPAPVAWQRLLWVLFQLCAEMVMVISAVIVIPSLAVWFLIVQYRR